MKTINQLYDVARGAVRRRVANTLIYASLIYASLCIAKPVEVSLEQRLRLETMILPPNPNDPLYRENQRIQRKAAYANLEAEMEAHDRIGAILA